MILIDEIRKRLEMISNRNYRTLNFNIAFKCVKEDCGLEFGKIYSPQSYVMSRSGYYTDFLCCSNGKALYVKKNMIGNVLIPVHNIKLDGDYWERVMRDVREIENGTSTLLFTENSRGSSYNTLGDSEDGTY